MSAAVTLAHAAGVPVEEILPLVLAAGATASVGLRVAWHRLRERFGSRRAPR